MQRQAQPRYLFSDNIFMSYLGFEETERSHGETCDDLGTKGKEPSQEQCLRFNKIKICSRQWTSN